MRTSELAHQGPDRLAHRGGYEVKLHWSRPPRPWWPVLKCRSVAGFELSTEAAAGYRKQRRSSCSSRPQRLQCLMLRGVWRSDITNRWQIEYDSQDRLRPSAFESTFQTETTARIVLVFLRSVVSQIWSSADSLLNCM